MSSIILINCYVDVSTASASLQVLGLKRSVCLLYMGHEFVFCFFFSTEFCYGDMYIIMCKQATTELNTERFVISLRKLRTSDRYHRTMFSPLNSCIAFGRRWSFVCLCHCLFHQGALMGWQQQQQQRLGGGGGARLNWGHPAPSGYTVSHKCGA